MNKLNAFLQKRPGRRNGSRRPMYGRSATSMVGLYLLALVGVPLATFALFMLGYSIYAALRNHPYIAEPLYNLMCRLSGGDVSKDAMLLEKIYLMEVCLGLLDSLYARFLQLRLSPQWQQEVADMRQWMTRTE